MAKTYDLIPADKGCDVFNVQFDLYTPRAHFMILPRKPKETYDKLSEEEKLKVIKLAMSMVSEYNLQKSAILSLHFGSWLSTPHKFHAHICVDVEDYLRIVDQKKAIIAQHLPPLNKRNKWFNGKDSKDYEANVRNYPSDTYFSEEVQDIQDIPKKINDETKPHKSNITCSSPFFLHLSEPRIGYVVKKSEEPRDNESKLKVLKAMIDYAKQKSLTEIKAAGGGDNGCHVCLVLDGKSHGKSILVNLP